MLDWMAVWIWIEGHWISVLVIAIILDIVKLHYFRKFLLWIRPRVRDWVLEGCECYCDDKKRPAEIGVWLYLWRSDCLRFNHNPGNRFVTLNDRDIDLDAFCHVVWRILRKNKNHKFVRGLIGRLSKAKLIEGSYKYTERIALPDGMLDKFCSVVLRKRGDKQPVDVFGFDVDLLDLALLAEYLLTMNDLIGTNDPRLTLFGGIKSLADERKK